MKESEIDLSQCLPLNADCKNCNIKLERIDVLFKKLPAIVRKSIIDYEVDYQILRCPKCGYCGIHTE